MLNTEIRFTGLDEAKEIFGDKIINDTIRSTVNKVARQARTQLSRDVREIYNVKAAAVREATRVRTAVGRGQEAFIFGMGKRIPLRDFGARQTARGVTLKVKRAGRRSLLPGRFIVDSIGGHVFERCGEKRWMRRGRYVGQLKQPIVKLVGPSIPQMMKSRDTVTKLLAYANEITPRVFQQELNFRIGRAVNHAERAAAQAAIR